MTDTYIQTSVAALRKAWAGLHLRARALLLRLVPGERVHRPPLLRRRRRWPMRVLLALVVVAVLGGAGFGALWWRLSSGPMALDLATPWLTAAIENRIGGGHRVVVGGTVVERDEEGRPALRMTDIAVRDSAGTVVANAPKAEIGLSAGALLTGSLQAERISLIGAEMSVRVDADGTVAVTAGGDERAIATSPVIVGRRAVEPAPGATEAPSAEASAAPPPPGGPFAGFLAWLDKLDALGIDGGALTEVGLKNGSLVVDDRRNGKRLTFKNINLSLARPKEGGVALAVSSSGTDGPWSMTATVSPAAEGRRRIEAVARDVSPKDVMLALRLGDGRFDADMPVSAILRAEIGADGQPQQAEGRVVVGAGYFGGAHDPEGRILIDEAQLNLHWDPASRTLAMPVEVLSGANRTTVLLHAAAPRDGDTAWTVTVPRGLIAFAPADRGRETPLVIDRIAVKARIDPVRQRIDLDQGDFNGVAAGVAVSGSLDFSTADPRLTIGAAGTRMTVSALKRLWPVFVAPPVRNWVVNHVQGGTVERVVVATNAPMSTMKWGGPPMPEDGLSVEIVATGAVVKPIRTLPAMRDADLTVKVTGRVATVRLGRGITELPSGRKMTLSNGLFEVPDTEPKPPPSRARFRIEGSVEAAAELIGLEPLREASGAPLDPATSRGNVAATVTTAMPLMNGLTKEHVTYTVEADLTGFSADRMVKQHKVEAAALKVTGNPQSLQVRGDVKIAGAPATIDYRRIGGGGDAEVRLQMTLDDAARTRLGLKFGDAVGGPVGVKLNGRVGERESRFAVEADLTQARVADLLPGWTKPAGKHVRAAFVLVDRGRSLRIDDLALEGSGTSVKGSVELDADGDLVTASFPTFNVGDGDKASLKAERASDGTLKVVMRGDVYDGRGFVKSVMSGSPPLEKGKKEPADVDLDIKLGAMAGFNGETLRGVELKLARRAGAVRSFVLSGKLGRDAGLIGDLRSRGGKQVVYLETADAGALFRFTDTYPRIHGGHMWVTMDPPSAGHAPSDGLLAIQNFVVRGEAALDRVAASQPAADPSGRSPGGTGGVQFSRMRVEFTKAPGRFTIRDGVVWGPAIGATVEGMLDYPREEVRLRGTFVPAYALNNMLARLPIVGLILGGGQNEGVFGVTYEVVGRPSAPVLRVNPISALAPGFLRKFLEFRSTADAAAAPPDPTR